MLLFNISRQLLNQYKILDSLLAKTVDTVALELIKMLDEDEVGLEDGGCVEVILDEEVPAEVDVTVHC
jgi:hypothetical protein